MNAECLLLATTGSGQPSAFSDLNRRKAKVMSSILFKLSRFSRLILLLHFGLPINPLRLWLGSPGVDKHILQVLEFCSLLRTFESDPWLSGKLAKLKQDALHPVFFELAMAQRLDASASPDGVVSLCAESEVAIGDFSLRLVKNLIACLA